jgi:hypothetical protein
LLGLSGTDFSAGLGFVGSIIHSFISGYIVVNLAFGHVDFMAEAQRQILQISKRSEIQTDCLKRAGFHHPQKDIRVEFCKFLAINVCSPLTLGAAFLAPCN